MEIHGTCEGRFGPVRKAFEANFEQATELGACVAVTVDGEFVVSPRGPSARRCIRRQEPVTATG